jgi:hypothetical protein
MEAGLLTVGRFNSDFDENNGFRLGHPYAVQCLSIHNYQVITNNVTNYRRPVSVWS